MTNAKILLSTMRLALLMLLGCAGLDAQAQSDEPWLARAPLPADTRPLLALIVDTSAAMAQVITTRGPYDSGRAYAEGVAAPCDPGRVYWRRGPGPAPDCSTTASLPLDSANAQTGFRCAAGRRALARTGTYVASRAAQWSPHAAGGYWHELLPGDDHAVECRADRGVHGSGDGAWYAAQGAAGPWSRDSNDEPAWDAPPLSDSYVFLSGNYLNYLAHPTLALTASRYAWTASLVANAAASVDELDLAVLRLSHDGLPGDDEGRGGMVALAPAALPAAAPSIGRALEGWAPAGPAPLAESLAEAAAWLSGLRLLFGDSSHAAPGVPLPSTPEVRDPQRPSRYVTPFTSACRPVSIALLTAGLPSADAGAGAAAAELPGFPGTARACDADCLTALAGWLRDTDLLPSIPGRQRAPVLIAAPRPLAPALGGAASAGGTPVFDLDDPLALIMMIAHALQHDAAVASGSRLSAVGTDWMTDGRHGPAAYFGLSVPAAAPRWAGNIRKYRWQASESPLAAPTIVDQNGDPAFDESGFALRPESRSTWSTGPDGADALLGGAAAALPPPAARRVYSDITSNALADPGNRVAVSNPALTREALGLTPRDPRSTTELIAWMLGVDAFDADGDGERDEPRRTFGDPGLSPPLVVRYGGPEDPALVFAATNDGVLHALDDTDGSERWAFVPRPLLQRLAGLSTDMATVARDHGLDGTVARHLFDADGDGRITPASGDRAWLIIGLGRGGPGYYALDVADPDRPRVLWSLGGTAASTLGDAWPGAVVARMRLDDRRQSPHRLVAVLAGGHDPAQLAWPRSHDQRGARLLILDAETGEVLWQAAGPEAEGADLILEDLTASLPSAPRVLDADGDGFADTLYLLGIDGHLWRIGFSPGAEPSGLATAGLLGRFGAADGAETPPRRFYSTPDVSYDAGGGRPRFIVSFGSGWLARPRDTTMEDRFYAVYDVPGAASQVGASESRVALRDQDLFDVTPSPYTAAPDARGWLLRLVSHGRGEKTAGSSLTFDHRLRFTTYQPLAAEPERPCGPPVSRSRLYTLDVRSGRPLNWVGDEPVPAEDLPVQGWPPGLRIVFPPRPMSEGCSPRGCDASPIGLIGGRSLDLDFRNDPVKTTWRRLQPTAE